MNKKTHEQFISEVFKLVGNEYIVKTPYKKATEEVIFFHSVCNNEFNMTPSKFLLGHRCIHCMSERRRETNIKKYGVSNPMQNKEIQKKQKKTLFDNYGVEYPTQNKNILNKLKKTNLKNHGVEFPCQNKEIMDKVKKTNLKKYGNTCSLVNEDIQQKRKDTMIEKYGVEYSMQNKEIQEKAKQTSLKNWGSEFYLGSEIAPIITKEISIEKYGVESYSQTDEYKERIKNTCLKRYGFSSPSMHPDIKEKTRLTMYKNGNVACSIQQKYIHNLIGGELNYPHKASNLDIAFSEEKIYVECDFGGHDLSVKLGTITDEQFKEREKRRWYALYRKDWKSIRIISTTDKLPSDTIILQMIDFAKQYLNTNHSWITFDIDNFTVKSSQFEQYYDYGKLRRITKLSA